MMRLKTHAAAILLVAVALLTATTAFAFWPTDGRKVASSGVEQAVIPAPDGFGGAIVSYLLAGTITQGGPIVNSIYLHHVKPNGELDETWPAQGKRLTQSQAGQTSAGIYNDGNGGFLVLWEDSEAVGHPRYKALRVNASGVPLSGWPSDGVFASTDAIDNSLQDPAVCPDGSGGGYFLVSRQDSTPGGPSDYNIYGTHFSNSGTIVSGWGPNGKVLINASGDQNHVRAIPDGSGGMIMVWNDTRNNPTGELFITRLSSSGSVVSGWTANGALVSTSTTVGVELPNLVSDGTGGAVVSWASADIIYAMRFSSSGAPLWPDVAHGAVVSLLSGQSGPPQMISDATGGALMVWSDDRAGFLSGAPDVYAQRLDGTGATKFTADGAAIATGANFQTVSGLVSAGGNDAIVVYMDATFPAFATNIYAQRITSTGGVGWSPGGVQVCGSGTALIGIAASDDQQGALVGWFDSRSTTDSGVYVARVSSNGITGPSAVTVGTVAANPVSGGVELDWSAFLTDRATFQVFRSLQRQGPFEAVGDAIQATPDQHDFHFRDTGIAAGTYYYQVGWREQGDWQRSATIVAAAGQAGFALHRIQQNPAHGVALIEYEMAAAAPARIDVFDLAGRRVRTLLNAAVAPGTGSVRWDGRGEDGAPVPAGAYFARLSSGAKVSQQKFVWVR